MLLSPNSELLLWERYYYCIKIIPIDIFLTLFKMLGQYFKKVTFKCSLIHEIFGCHVLSKIVPYNVINNDENHSELKLRLISFKMMNF
jgi:hypothetical protein